MHLHEGQEGTGSAGGGGFGVSVGQLCSMVVSVDNFFTCGLPCSSFEFLSPFFHVLSPVLLRISRPQ